MLINTAGILISHSLFLTNSGFESTYIKYTYMHSIILEKSRLVGLSQDKLIKEHNEKAIL